jgi:hypothetical protein
MKPNEKMNQPADTYEPPEVIELGAVVDMTFGSESLHVDNITVGGYNSRVVD